MRTEGGRPSGGARRGPQRAMARRAARPVGCSRRRLDGRPRRGARAVAPAAPARRRARRRRSRGRPAPPRPSGPADRADGAASTGRARAGRRGEHQGRSDGDGRPCDGAARRVRRDRAHRGHRRHGARDAWRRDRIGLRRRQPHAAARRRRRAVRLDRGERAHRRSPLHAAAGADARRAGAAGVVHAAPAVAVHPTSRRSSARWRTCSSRPPMASSRSVPTSPSTRGTRRWRASSVSPPTTPSGARWPRCSGRSARTVSRGTARPTRAAPTGRGWSSCRSRAPPARRGG